MFLVILAVAMALAALVCNPVEVGCRRFYIRNLREKAIVGNIGYAFDVEYKNIVKIMFFRDLYLLLWTLLFVIPGIIKYYEYRMVPYILAENPSDAEKPGVCGEPSDDGWTEMEHLFIRSFFPGMGYLRCHDRRNSHSVLCTAI